MPRQERPSLADVYEPPTSDVSFDDWWSSLDEVEATQPIEPPPPEPERPSRRVRVTPQGTVYPERTNTLSYWGEAIPTRPTFDYIPFGCETPLVRREVLTDPILIDLLLDHLRPWFAVRIDAADLNLACRKLERAHNHDRYKFFLECNYSYSYPLSSGKRMQNVRTAVMKIGYDGGIFT